MNNWKGKGSNLRKVSNDLARLCGFKMQKGIAERIWCKDPGREARIEAASLVFSRASAAGLSWSTSRMKSRRSTAERRKAEKITQRTCNASSSPVPYGEELTNAALAEETTRLCRGSWRRRVLDLRGGGSARLAHGVRAMHDGWCCGLSECCVFVR